MTPDRQLTDWRPRAAALAEQLAAAGALSDPRWAAATRETPRHVFVPRFYDQRPDLTGWQEITADTDPDRWADAVYSDRTLVTEVRSTPELFDGFPVPVSSSTLPSLMLRMLHVLDINDPADRPGRADRAGGTDGTGGTDVVEIGTGTGYNAALLCAGFGDRRVCSVDVEPELVESARRRLAALGQHPHLQAIDAAGWEPPPFDRLIATCGVRTVPSGWLRAARPEAVLVVPLTGTLADGGLARLVADGAGSAHGRFRSFYAGFMALRTLSSDTHPMPAQATPGPERGRYISQVDPSLLDHDQPLAMIAQLRLPRLEPRRTAVTDDGQKVTILRSSDGSWVRAEHLTDGGASVRSGGPTNLWSVVEDAHDWWTAASRPAWDRFGLSITQTAQTIWLDNPGHELARHKPVRT